MLTLSKFCRKISKSSTDSIKNAYSNFPFIVNYDSFPDESLFQPSNPAKLYIKDYFSNSAAGPEMITNYNLIDIKRQKYTYLSSQVNIKMSSTENAQRAHRYVNEVNLGRNPTKNHSKTVKSENPKSRIHTLKNHEQKNRMLKLINVNNRIKTSTLREMFIDFEVRDIERVIYPVLEDNVVVEFSSKMDMLKFKRSNKQNYRFEVHDLGCADIINRQLRWNYQREFTGISTKKWRKQDQTNKKQNNSYFKQLTRIPGLRNLTWMTNDENSRNSVDGTNTFYDILMTFEYSGLADHFYDNYEQYKIPGVPFWTKHRAPHQKFEPKDFEKAVEKEAENKLALEIDSGGLPFSL